MTKDKGSNRAVRRDSIAYKTLTIVGIVALAGILLYLIVLLSQMLLVIFGGILLAILLDGLVRKIEQKVPLPRIVNVPLLVLLVILILVAVGFLAGPRIDDQFTKLSDRLPEAVEQIEGFLQGRVWGQAILNSIGSMDNLPSSGAIIGRITGIFSTAAGALTGAILIFFVGLYLAISPSLYLNNTLRLVSSNKRERAREIFGLLGNALRWWLAGRFASMFVVGLLTAISLWIAGIPLAFSLGLIAAIFSFVPFIGPIMGAIPAIMVALAEDPVMALWVVAIYSVVQFVESYLVTPIIQQRAVSVPPALLITAQVLMGVLFGIVGVFLATPLLVVIVVTVQLLYVEDLLGEKAKIMGEH